MEKLIKSKNRVSAYGEVYTGKREVKSMVNLVKKEARKIESTFLEPAVGTGNFLIEILERKLRTAKRLYKHNQFEFEKAIFKISTTLYGIDILEDNVKECRENLYNLIEKKYRLLFKNNCNQNLLKSINYVLSQNIQCADTLTGITSDNNPLGILIPEWVMNDIVVKRSDYAFNDLIEYESLNKVRKSWPEIKFEEVYLYEKSK